MFLFLVATSLAALPADADRVSHALELCRPGLERRSAGEIGAIAVDGSIVRGRWTVIRGPMTALIGMGEPGPGNASTHHLIRAKYNYICWVQNDQVKRIVMSRLE
jgi:hypothetical protein